MPRKRREPVVREIHKRDGVVLYDTGEARPDMVIVFEFTPREHLTPEQDRQVLGTLIGLLDEMRVVEDRTASENPEAEHLHSP